MRSRIVVLGIVVLVYGVFWSVVSSGCGGTILLTEASTNDVAANDVIDSGDASDAPDDARYHDLSDQRFWSSLDLSQFLSPGSGFANAGFDGQYAYWHAEMWDAQNGVQSVFVRYDTRKAFAEISSWSKWPLPPPMNGGAGPILFDGRYLYLGCTGGAKPREFRFDTQGTFGDFAALSLSQPPPGLDGGDGFLLPSGSGALDGRFAYFPDEANPTGVRVRRLDTQGDFIAPTSWSVAYSSSLARAPAIFASPFLFLTPQPPTTGAVLAYDTRLDFGSPSSWTSFSPQGIAPDVAFAGVGSDGRFVYFVPQDEGPWRASGLIVRHDLAAHLNDSSSWQSFSTSQVQPLAETFHRASWDGRYFYFLVGSDGGKGAVITRYDTAGSFASPASWSAFDMTPLVPKTQQPPRWLGGVVFDGEFLYVAAYDAPIIMRFDARTPRRLSKGFSGVFY